MMMMMVAVVWNFLLPLLLMFIIIWPKGLSNDQICSKSAETVCRVKKCPANQTEWDKAAQRKNCSEIQKYENCTKVEYHCLVNEFRNETIEVCTVSRHVQGYCPIYSENKAKNDYKKHCENQTPCNCSSGYLSTEAYKWQCCYNGINNDQDVKLFPNKYCRGKTIAADSDKDQSNNVHVEVWLVPLLLIVAAVVLVLVGCVCYGMKRQNKTFFEALKICKICTLDDTSTQRSLESKGNEMNGTDDPGTSLLSQEKGHNPPAETQVDGSIQEPETPNGDSLNQGMSTSNTQEEIISSEPVTPLLDTSPRPFTPATPNGDSSNQASDTPNEVCPQPSTSASQITGGEITISEFNFPVSQSSDSRAEGLFLNPMSMAKDEHSSNTQNKEANINERVKNLKKEKKRLGKRVKFIYGGQLEYLEYKTKSIQQKIKVMLDAGKTDKRAGKRVDELKQRVGKLEKMLQSSHMTLDEWGVDINIDHLVNKKPDGPDKPLKPKVKEHPSKFDKSEAGSHVEDRFEEELAHSDNDQTEVEGIQKKEEADAMWRPPFQNTKISMKTKKEDASLWPEDANGASSHDVQSLNDEEEPNFDKKALRDRVETISRDLKKLRMEYRKSREHLYFLEDIVSGIETDCPILLESFGISDETNAIRASQGMNLNEIEKLVENIRTDLDKLREKLLKSSDVK